MKNFISAIIMAAATFACAEAQTLPTVTTNTRYARGATSAFGRLSYKSNGASIKEVGFCWSSTSKEPTVEDNHSNKYISNNGSIYKMEGLEPATIYYARAYAMTKEGDVAYGDAIKFCTLPMGKVQYSYDNGGSSEENARITNALEVAVDYWNRLTNIEGFGISCHYGAATPTADCSYGGWMRVGPNASYQKAGTIMHEALHGIGVGTHGVWNNATTPMRAGSGTGVWLGVRTTELMQFLENSTTATLTGDATHMWPYGINGAHEDSGTEALYTANSLIAQALGEDGLPCSDMRGYASPAYTFVQEDDVKYYIKSVSDAHGQATSFLTESADHKLQWKEMTAEEAEKNDAAAWMITFNPAKQYYMLRNAATGYIMTYNTTGSNGIKTIDHATAEANDYFHFMKSKYGYWLIHPQSWTATPYCLAAGLNGGTSAKAFSLDPEEKALQWNILTIDQAKALEDANSIAARELFKKNQTIVENLYNTPHREITESADNTFTTELAKAIAENENGGSTAEITARAEYLLAIAKQFLAGVAATDSQKPFDLTDMLVNPNFDNGVSGWTIGAGYACNFNEVEYYEKSPSTYQTVKDLPMGTYRGKVQGFQRPGSYTANYTDYTAGNNKVTVKLFLNTTSTGGTLIKNMMEERQTAKIHNDDKQMTDKTWVPNTMASAQAYFAKGLYDNETTYYYNPTGGKGALRIGISGTNTTASWWTIFDNFRLYYYGPMTWDEIFPNPDGISEITMDDSNLLNGKNEGANVKMNAKGVFSLTGQRISTSGGKLPAGLYIINGKITLTK